MTTFADLGLTPSTVQAVTDTGYTVPTPIQEQAIPVALAGRDVLGIAQTGTGKTAAFTLPMIDRLSAGRAKARMPRSLVVAPTRELADQVAGSFEKYARGTKLSWALLIGGVSFKDQETKIDRGVDVLIATPGRLLDFYERRKIMLLDVKTLVVDEADRMLDMGFIPDLERIFEITPKQKQTLFFSATMPPEITRLTGQFLKDPTRIEVSRPASTGENIKQFVAKLPTGEPKAKRMALRALIERAAPESGIIFCNRKSEVDIVAKSLQKYGYDAGPIHGDLDQSQRMKTLESFRAGELKLLVASDVAARGLDIPQVSDVFNYDVPHQPDDYVHRIGRTGRAGRLGETFMIVTPNDERSYDKVIKLTRSEPEEIVLELDWEEAARGAERDKERYGSGRGREGRDGRGRGDRDGGRSRGRDRGDQRDRPVADHGQRASTEAISTPEPGEAAPVETRSAPPPREEGRADEPRRDRGDRPRRDRGRGRDREERPAPVAAPDLGAAEEGYAPDEVETAPDAPMAAAADRAEPRRADREEPRRAEREEGFGRRGDRDRDRGPRRDRGERPERGDRDRFDRDDRPVTGFGGPADTPAFLLRSAAAAIAALQKRGATQDTADEPEDDVAEARETASTEAAPERGPERRPERGRSRRRRGGDRPEVEVVTDAAPDADETEVALETAQAAAPPPPPPAAPAAPPPPPPPAPPPPRRPRRRGRGRRRARADGGRRRRTRPGVRRRDDRVAGGGGGPGQAAPHAQGGGGRTAGRHGSRRAGRRRRPRRRCAGRQAAPGAQGGDPDRRSRRGRARRRTQAPAHPPQGRCGRRGGGRGPARRRDPGLSERRAPSARRVSMRLSDFDFDLPDDRIALRPASPRDAARLLVVRPGEPLADRAVRDLPELLAAGDVLVFNDTRVIPARLDGVRERDGEAGAVKVEATLHRRAAPDGWTAFMRPGKRLRPGDAVRFGPGLTARVEAKLDGGEVALRFDLGGAALDAAIAQSGAMPLPPYIASKRPGDARDLTDYQTVYAREDGSVAAPTAGLHVTPELLERLAARGIGRAFVTLHVGAGTFLPVKTDEVADHRMHAERGEVSPETAAALNAARARGGRIVCVGTTSLRLLESAADVDGTVRPYSGETSIFITPGHRFRACDALLSNFHLPRSTLVMLVAAFAGHEAQRAAYAHAVADGYRFYSYGDAGLWFRDGA